MSLSAAEQLALNCDGHHDASGQENDSTHIRTFAMYMLDTPLHKPYPVTHSGYYKANLLLSSQVLLKIWVQRCHHGRKLHSVSKLQKLPGVGCILPHYIFCSVCHTVTRGNLRVRSLLPALLPSGVLAEEHARLIAL